MSRVGRKPVIIPDKVTVSVAGDAVSVKGPMGALTQQIRPEITVKVDGKNVVVERKNEERLSRALHGLTRALIQNMVIGVSQGYKKELDVVGVGYKADVAGKTLNMALGFSHPIVFPIPEGIKVLVEKNTHITVTGFDKQLVGEVASQIRRFRKPEPYKGKGVKYSNEVIKRKVGKAAAGAGAK